MHKVYQDSRLFQGPFRALHRSATRHPPSRNLLQVVLRTLLLVLALVFSSAGAAEGLPGLLTQTGHGSPFAVRPAQIIYTGDGSGVLGGFTGHGPFRRFGQLRWPSWTDTQARGSGAAWLDNCTPNCAEGTFHPYAAQVRVFAPHDGHFTRLTLRYSYNGKRVIERLGIAKFGANYSYYTIGFKP